MGNQPEVFESEDLLRKGTSRRQTKSKYLIVFINISMTTYLEINNLSTQGV